MSACLSCAVKTLPCWATGNVCLELFVDVLEQISAPAPGVQNVSMLVAWSMGECSQGDGRCNPFAGYNPLATTWGLAGDTGGCWSCNSGGCFVRCYTSLHHGATAIADTLKNGHYPTILQALREDWIPCQWKCSAALRAELGVWGTGAGWLGTCPGPCPVCTGVVCGPCQACAGGRCNDLCPPEDTCVGGVCIPPVSPPPSSSSAAGLIAGALLVGGFVALVVGETRRRPGVVRALEGGSPSMGTRGAAATRPVTPRGPTPTSTRTPVGGRRVGRPTGAGLGAGL